MLLNVFPFRALCRSACGLVAILFVSSVFALPANVTTWRNDNARSGINAAESSLTHSDVNSKDFGKLFTIAADGIVMAQPLYLSSVSVPGKGIHNVVYIATEHDSVYACDADDGTVLWHAVLLKSGETPSDDHGCSGISLPELGITATPVITGNMIYVQAMSKTATGTDVQRLHALDVRTGAEMAGGPVDIAASYPGSNAYSESQNGVLSFHASLHFDRAGLALSNGIVYTTWTSFCDAGPYNGWIIGYDTSLKQAGVLPTTPNGRYASIWQSGAAPAVDANGNMFALTGNGSLDQTFDAAGFPAQRDFGNSIIKFSLTTNLLQVTDYFSPFNSTSESDNDIDLGSGGALLLPDLTDANGAVRHLLVAGGKDQHLFVVDRDNMGKYKLNATDNSYVYQDVPPEAVGAGLFTTPLYFNGKLYVAPLNSSIKAFQVSNARVNTTPVAQTTAAFGYPGTTPVLSANGTSNAILWAIQRATPAVLRAFNADDLTQELYNSAQAANGRDEPGSYTKFVPPAVANGKVYMPANTGVAVYGLFNPPRFGNISTRAQVGIGDNVLIGGFIVEGSAPRTLLVRGIGPSLKANGTPVPGALQNPFLELRDSRGTIITTNDDWGKSAQKDAISATGLAPQDARESAILMSLNPGTYTAIVRGVGNTTGLGLVEIYDLSPAPNSTLANLSSRGFVGIGDDALIGGIIVLGVAPQTVILRAIGPDLADSGVAGSLADPTIELHNANGGLLASNDNWRSNQETEILATDVAPHDDRDAAILRALPAGNYTAVVRGAGNSTGVALVEAYALR